ncbi:DUF1223 domain-containing protein, partial [bacterium]|nr:DUF1223 domain-containing protein [bacterium]
MRSKLRIAAAMMILVGAARASADGVAVVELFTSEGCSSCPPADRVLAELNRAARDQHDSNTIALSWHVDYWDRLGWKDPYSSPENSQRQVEMARDANGGRVYTPQAIVNGRATLVGSRRQQLTETIATARSNDHVASLEVKADSPADGTVTVHWKLPDSVQERSFRVEVLLTEDQLV